MIPGVDGHGLVVMLDSAGATIARMKDELAAAEHRIVERDSTIAHLREQLRESRGVAGPEDA